MKSLRLVTILALAAAPAACKKEKTDAPAEETAPEPTEAEAPTEPTEPTEAEAPAEEPVVAEAAIEARSKSKVGGTVTFTELEGGKVKVDANITGLEPGEHGFHVHETGDCSAPDAKSAGGHFNPTGAPHGAPAQGEHHAGDFGNITADDSGNATGSWEVDFISLEDGAENSVVGKAVVVHAKADDLKSQPSGDAGGRIGCGVIQVQDGGAAAEGADAEGAAAEGAEGAAAEGEPAPTE